MRLWSRLLIRLAVIVYIHQIEFVPLAVGTSCDVRLWWLKNRRILISTILAASAGPLPGVTGWAVIG